MLIFNAVMKLLKKAVIDKPTAAIYVLVLLGSVFLNLSPIWFVLVAGIAGVLLKNREVKGK